MSNTNKSQSFRILNFMKKGRGITPVQALNTFGCFRLASRIHELKSMGHNITTTKVTKNDKTFAQYNLN
jgi:hypothetical protein